MGDYCIVQTTLDSEDNAQAMADALVEARLAACVQIQPIQSVYRWEGKICREKEFLLLIKTRTLRFDAIVALIRERHGYTTPEIIQLPIVNGSDGYLRWLDGNSRD